MPSEVCCTPLDWLLTPRDALRRWPSDQPLAALCSAPGLGEDPRWARWSFLASPEPPLTIGADDPDPIGRLVTAIDATRLATSIADLPVPFAGGWVVALGYELGRSVEPTAAVRASRVDPAWPWSIVLWRCSSVLAYDHAAGKWWSISRGNQPATSPMTLASESSDATFKLAEPSPTRARSEYVAAVRRAVEYIHAGDCFQVNLSHRIGATFSGSTRSLFASMLGAAAPWYGAYLEVPQGRELHAALSVSPELFLDYDARSRSATTRPIKGTRPGRVDPSELRGSQKDQAELAMIIDLMRNDLGRVCEIGSVRVDEARAIERHGWSDHAAGGLEGVHHGVATIRGTVRRDRSAADMLRAFFPGGSITGAPKVRAMQIIEELEPEPRGLYTGAIGYISDCGNVSLNIAIRTALVRGMRADADRTLDRIADGQLTYGAGAGIVADSVPEQEWQETLDKAGVLWSVASASASAAIRTRHVSRPQELSA
jgi:para-aminobenzoate synthetase component I